MFGRGDRGRAGTPSQNPYAGLRAQILGLDPAAIPGSSEAGLAGGLMEIGIESGVATLVALVDGTTSMYFSGGGGIIGGGAHAPVVAAGRMFLSTLSAHLPGMDPDPVADLPGPGTVHFRALTGAGRLVARASDAELKSGAHRMSNSFLAGHGVITALRQIPGVE